MIKNILLDLDDTILDFHKAERVAVGKVLEEFGIAATDNVLSRYSEINAEHWRMLERGELTREQVLVYRFKALFRELRKDTNLAPAVAKKYENNLCIGHYFIPGAREAIEKLFGHYRLYLVSNGTARVQESRIKSAGIAGYFSGIFISQYLGYNKPDKRFFDCCTAEIPDYRAEETLIMGDSLTSDIRGGINAGIRTVWFNSGDAPPGDIAPDYRVKSWEEFISLVGKIQ